uniref:NAD(P)H-hydrate dehydratase n=1 Tax=Acidiphilium sp. TaxID=527 RepID=UPI002583E8E2
MLDARALPRHLPPPELLDPASMARADRAAIAAGVSGLALMEAAGRAVARAMRRRLAPGRVLVLAGPGNNGGDGYVAARLLQQAGWPVRLAALAPPRADGDAALAAARWSGPMAPFTPEAAASADYVIDAVFGAGLSRPLAAPIAATLAAARRIVAVDVPSGLDGATGAARGAVSSAAFTVTFFRLKPGHLLLPGRALCGEIMLADIGLPASVLGAIGVSALLNQPALWRLRRAMAADHKYRRGSVAVLAGEMTGAALLAAHAARRIGAGLVSIQSLAPLSQAPPGLIVRHAPLAELRADAVVCGPGLGVAMAQARLPAVLRAGRCVVADADALTACAGRPETLRGAAVLTPHDGEFTRVFGAIGEDRLAAARGAACLSGAVVVLKGAATIIAAPDGRAAINASAPPALATAGSGDVLAGMIGGLLAQGLAAFEAALAAVWLH